MLLFHFNFNKVGFFRVKDVSEFVDVDKNCVNQFFDNLFVKRLFLLVLILALFLECDVD